MKINFENKPKGQDKKASAGWAQLVAILEKNAVRFPDEKDYYLEQAAEARQFSQFYA